MSLTRPSLEIIHDHGLAICTLHRRRFMLSILISEEKFDRLVLDRKPRFAADVMYNLNGRHARDILLHRVDGTS
jgi:hypothetical protein